jgi:hypothetical protein
MQRKVTRKPIPCQHRAEIATNYLKQKTPQEIRNHYSNLINGVMDAEYVAKNTRPAAKPTDSTRANAPAGPAAPPARPSLSELKKKNGG